MFHHMQKMASFFQPLILTSSLLISNNGDTVDYEAIISEKFPNCSVEVIPPDLFEVEELIEYISDDIVIYKPHSVMVYRHLIRFLVNVGERGKFYYLEGFSDEDIKLIHEGLLKFTWRTDTKINLFKNSNPDRDVLGL